MKKYLLMIDNISQKTGVAVSLLVFPMIACVVYEVTMRYFFHNPTEWVFEMTLFLYAASVVLGGCYVHKEHGHVGMDVLYLRLSTRKRAMLDVVTSFIFFAFIGVLLVMSTKMAIGSWAIGARTDSTWGPPVYPIITTIPIAALLLLLQGVAKFIRDLHLAITGKEY
jgi:TRAP-type mannitol/chloroaromatic compound transport system permease small subunit